MQDAMALLHVADRMRNREPDPGSGASPAVPRHLPGGEHPARADAELALKALIMCSTGSSPKGHDLLDLFNRLPENMRRRVERRTQPEPARRAAAPAQAPQCGRRDRFRTGALSVMIDEFRGQDG